MVSLVELEAIDCNGLDQHPWQCLTWLIVGLLKICCQRIKLVHAQSQVGTNWLSLESKYLIVSLKMVIYKYAHLDCRKCPMRFLSRCTLEQHQIACVAPFSTALKCTEIKKSYNTFLWFRRNLTTQQERCILYWHKSCRKTM